MIVLLTSVFILLPVGATMRIIAQPGLRLLSTLVLSFFLTYLLTRLLRRNFLRTAAASEWTLRPTLRPPGRHCAVAVQKLTTAGFAVSQLVVVSNDDGQTMTRPMALMHRHQDGLTVTVHSLGSHAATLMAGGWWLVTSSTGVVRHPSILVQPAKKRDPLDVVRVHTAGLDLLAAKGLKAGDQPSPFDCALTMERMEQESLRAFRDDGDAAPRNGALADSGAVLTPEMIQQIV